MAIGWTSPPWPAPVRRCASIPTRHGFEAVPVVYQDENVLVAVKPAGVSCEPDRRGGKTFPQLLCEQLGPGTAEPLLCRRLDNPHGGIAECWLARRRRSRPHRMRSVGARCARSMSALYAGTPRSAPCGAGGLACQGRASARACGCSPAEAEGARRVITEYDVLERGDCARLRVRLHTGRRTQSDPCAYGFHRPSASGRRPVWRPGFQRRDEGPSAYAMRRVAHAANLRAAGLLLNGRTFAAAPAF